MKYYWFCLFSTVCCWGQAQTYLPAVGVRDAERLSILNRVYNPSSIEFLQKRGIQPGMTVLDLGCGTGIMSCEIARLVGPAGCVICVDNSEEQLMLARQRAKGEGLNNLIFLNLSAYDLSSLKQPVDAVYCRFLLLHLKEPDKILAQVYELLQQDGLFFLDEPTGLKLVTCEPKLPAFTDYLR